MSSSKSEHRVAVVGGGIAGLTAAYRLSRLSPAIHLTLIEAGNQLGGVLQTTRQDGFLIEHSADSFISNANLPWAKDLCDELGFGDQIIPTHQEYRRALIWLAGRLHPVPDGFQLMKTSDIWSVLRSPLLSIRGKLRLASESFITQKKNAGDESLQSFAVRRLGNEAFERLVQPLVSGIYTADATKLSMNAALPQFVKMESEYGSLAAAVRKEQRRDSSGGARYNQFFAPREGMSALVDAIRNQLADIQICLDQSVTSVRQVDGRWELTGKDGVLGTFDGVVLCLPARVCARLVSEIDTQLSTDLQSIEHASSSVVCLGYQKSQFGSPLEAFGCVVPAIANRRVIAISFSSMKFPHRAPGNQHLLRVFIGGAMQPEFTELSDDATIKLATEEVATILNVSGEPTFASVHRWNDTMPQYHLNHLDRVAAIRQRLEDIPRFEIVSNGLDGVGIPQRIRGGDEAARRIATIFKTPSIV